VARRLSLASTPTDTGKGPLLPSPIRVVLADAHALMRRSLRLLLEAEEGIEVIAEASDLPSAVRQVDGSKPHVLGFGLSASERSMTEAIGRLRERAPETQIVVLTMQDHPGFAQRALASGARGFVLKQFADSELPHAVRAAARGERYISPRVASRLDTWHHS